MADAPDVDRLEALIAALDKRHVQPQRAQEAGIARDASAMRAQAVARLTQIQHPDDPTEETDMTDARPVRPPPVPGESPAPDDFDGEAALRWRAWQVRGRAESARTRVHVRVVLGVAGVASAGLAAARLFWP